MLAKAIKPIYGDYGAVDEGIIFDCPDHLAKDLLRLGLISLVVRPLSFPPREMKVLRPPELKGADGSTMVSCIMPTADRKLWIEGAIRNFQEQTHAPKELIVLDDGENPVGDLCRGPGVRYYRTERMSLGAKRNRACALACGPIIAHWDDDDRYSPERLARQVYGFRMPVSGFCGITVVNQEDRRAWRYRTRKANYAVGSSLMYSKLWWGQHPFLEISSGEDSAFVAAAKADIAVEDGCDLMVAYRHAGCTSHLPPEGPEFQRIKYFNLPAWAEK